VGGKHYSFEETHDGEMKLCPHCGHWKHSSMFNRNRREKDGLASWCRECANQANRDSRRYAKEHGGSQRVREHRRGLAVEGRCLAAAEHLRGSWSLGADREAARWERDKALELVAQEAEQRRLPYMDVLAKVGALAASDLVMSPYTGKRKGWFRKDGV
jgi:superfamily II helicase